MSWLDTLSQSRPGPRPVPGGSRDGVFADGGRHEGRAGDDFNERTDWADILLPLGAVLHHESGGVRYWTRPGKDRRDGHSATTGYADDADRLKVFTTHWPPFADDEVYTKFGAYALLNHAGDHQAAARELRRHGYGSQRPAQGPPAGSARNQPPEMGPHPADQVQADGSSSLAPVVEISGRQRPEPLTELGFARRLGRQARRRTPVRRAVEPLARLGRHQVGTRRRRARTAVYESDRPRGSHRPDPRQRRPGHHPGGQAGRVQLGRQGRADPGRDRTGDSDHARPARRAPLYLLNCRNGVVDLQTGELLAHDPALLLTKKAAAPYEPDADGTVFTAFFERIQPSEEMRLFIRRLLGLSLEGTVTAHILPIFYGDGANGKSTLTDAVMTALGDYADAADPDLLRARTFDAHPTGVADLFGLRLALLHESDAGHRLAEGTVKRLTGGDRLKARRMREDFWSFDPSHTFVMLTNHKPGVSGTDEGIWRRLRLVPFEVIIPGPERDEDLGGKLAGEAGAILAWLVAGYLDWRKNGLAEPGKVTEATQAYRAESDPLGRFISERCLCMPAMRAGSTELFKAFEKWCAAEREDPGTPTAFGNAMKAKGFESRKSNGRMLWHGIGLADDTPGRVGRAYANTRARV